MVIYSSFKINVFFHPDIAITDTGFGIPDSQSLFRVRAFHSPINNRSFGFKEIDKIFVFSTVREIVPRP